MDSQDSAITQGDLSTLPGELCHILMNLGSTVTLLHFSQMSSPVLLTAQLRQALNPSVWFGNHLEPSLIVPQLFLF